MTIELLFLIPFVIILVGIILVILSFLSSDKEEGEVKKEGGAFILIGPIPIVLASNKKLGLIIIIAGIVLTILSIFLFLLIQGVVI